jgi:hypothetical protein
MTPANMALAATTPKARCHETVRREDMMDLLQKGATMRHIVRPNVPLSRGKEPVLL